MPKVVRTIVVDYKLWERVRKIAYNKGLTISSIIETALENYLNKNQEK